jgi:hypothetical protein
MADMDDHKIDYNNFEPQRLTLGAVIPKKSKADPARDKKEAPYQQASFVYLYRLPNGQEIKGNFLLEECKVKVYGIRAPEGNDYQYQAQAIYDKNDPETKKCLETKEIIRKRMIELISEPKTLKELKANHTNLKSLVYYPIDKITSEPDPNRNPTQFYKLLNYEKNKTRFLGPSPKEGVDPVDIPWNVLMQAEFSGRPLIKYTHIYCNGNTVSPQHHMFSMAVTEVKDMESRNLQRDTLQGVNPELASAFTQNLAKLQASLGDKINQLSVSNKSTMNQGQPQGQGQQNFGNSQKFQERKSEPLTSNPTDVSNYMRSGQTQTFAGNIAPNFQMQPNPNMNYQPQNQGNYIQQQPQMQPQMQQQQPIQMQPQMQQPQMQQQQPIQNMQQQPMHVEQNQQPIGQTQFVPQGQLQLPPGFGNFNMNISAGGNK